MVTTNAAPKAITSRQRTQLRKRASAAAGRYKRFVVELAGIVECSREHIYRVFTAERKSDRILLAACLLADKLDKNNPMADAVGAVRAQFAPVNNGGGRRG